MYPCVKRAKTLKKLFLTSLALFFLIFLKDMFVDKATERKVRSFVIKCPRGCQWTGELRSKEVGARANCNLAFVVIALFQHGILCPHGLHDILKAGKYDQHFCQTCRATLMPYKL